MTAALFAKSSTQSALQHNGADTVVYEAGGIVSGLGKNKIINGNPLINQRAVSGTVVLAAGIYGHDRWKAGASGCTYTFATSNNVTTLTISAGSLVQVVEGLNLQSGAVVLGWNGTAQGKIDAGSYGASGVTGTAVGGTNMSVEFGTGTLSLVQLETGSIRSNFEQRPYGMELALCQRYYYRSAAQGVTLVFGGVGYNRTTTAAEIYVPFPVVMRSSPSALEQTGAAGDYSILNLNTATTCSAVPTFSSGTPNSASILLTVAAGLTAGQGSMCRSVASTAFLGFSAEL